VRGSRRKSTIKDPRTPQEGKSIVRAGYLVVAPMAILIVALALTMTAAPPTADTTPPETVIDSGPSTIETSHNSSARFAFSSSEPNSTFECKLDDAAYSGCASSKAYTGLDDGTHTFYVRTIDAAGNVEPVPEDWTWAIDTTPIAVTFDDGPHPANTPKILDVLRRHGVKATFFVVGQMVDSYPHLVRREHEEGHVVGNHSYTHPHLTALGSAGVEKELRDTNAAVTSAGVPKPTLFRPPYGYGSTNAEVEGVATSLGMTQILGAVPTEDWKDLPPEEVCEQVVRDVEPGAIITLHDAWTTNTDATLECIITRLKAEGYSFGLIYPSSTYSSLNDSYVEIR
jgi:peptidoglycan/xylan/chitin deacetylase (PgdA/CDA1 family)